MNEVQGVGETQQFGIYLCEFWTFLEFLLHFCKALSAIALFIFKSNGCVGLYSCSLRLCAVISRCFPWGIICLHTRCPGMKSPLFHMSQQFLWKQLLTLEELPGNPVLEVFCSSRLLKRRGMCPRSRLHQAIAALSLHLGHGRILVQWQQLCWKDRGWVKGQDLCYWIPKCTNSYILLIKWLHLILKQCHMIAVKHRFSRTKHLYFYWAATPEKVCVCVRKRKKQTDRDTSFNSSPLLSPWSIFTWHWTKQLNSKSPLKTAVRSHLHRGIFFSLA